MAADSRVSGHGLVAALAVTQTVGYGTLSYAFPVVLRPIAADLGASPAAVTGAYTCSVLAGAAMAIPVGRWLDRHGGRALMTVGSILATALVAAWSQVHHLWQLYAVLIGTGAVGAMVLYEAAFAVIVSWSGPARRASALLAVTVVAGFASAVYLPLTGLLVTLYDWRLTLLILAVLHGLITVPLHASVVRRAPAAPTMVAVAPIRRRDRPFWILTVAFVAHAAAIAAMLVHLVGYLTSRGHPVAFAAGIAGLLGVLSVTGRLVFTGARRRLPTTTVVAAIFLIQAGAAILLWLAGGTRTGAVVAVVGFGLGFGVATLAKPILLADRYGTTGFATLAGTLALPVTVAKAAGPLGAAALLGTGGYPAILAAIAGACAVSATSMILCGDGRK